MHPHGENAPYRAVHAVGRGNDHGFADGVWHLGNRHYQIEEVPSFLPVVVQRVRVHDEARAAISNKFDMIQARHKDVGRGILRHFSSPTSSRGCRFSLPAHDQVESLCAASTSTNVREITAIYAYASQIVNGCNQSASYSRGAFISSPANSDPFGGTHMGVASGVHYQTVGSGSNPVPPPNSHSPASPSTPKRSPRSSSSHVTSGTLSIGAA